MKVTVEDISSVEKRLSVEVPPDTVSQELDRAYRSLKEKVTIKGFRKGKAPRAVLERHYGSQVEEEVLQSLIDQTLPKALEEAKAELVLQPRLDSASSVKPTEPFSYTAVLDLWPEFALPEYKGTELVEPLVEVTEDEVQGQLDALRSHFARLKAVEEDRPVIVGDLVIVDYSGSVDGEPVDGLTEENYYLEVGAGHFNSQFEEQLVNMTRDAENDIEVTYPDDAVNAKVAGKTVKYRVCLKDIKERVLPDLNDDFARELGAGFTTLDDVRERLRRQVKADKEEAAKASLRRQLLERLREQVDFPVPERLVEIKLTQMVDNVTSHLQERGMDLERAGLSEDRLREKMRDDSVNQAKTELILDKIAEAEGVTLSTEEVSKHVEHSARQLGMDPSHVASTVAQHILPKLRAQKTVEFLLAHAVIKKASEGEAPAEKSEVAESG